VPIGRGRRRGRGGDGDQHTDEQRLNELYQNHAAAVQRFVAGHVIDVQHRDDIVQETFVRAWKRIREIDTVSGNPQSFLFTIAHNLIIDQWRSQARREETLVSTDVTVPARDHVNRSLEQILIGESLRQLSPEHRQVIVALYFDDLTVAQAADRLDISPGTVKSRSYYAVRALRAAFEEMGLL
jgi:RNA polymerase sigma-70 factor, ECF subfamily